MGNAIEKKDILKVAAFLGMGYYRVKESGEFVEATAFARDLFGIPQDETDLSKHSISDLYIFQAERKLRIDKLNIPGIKPISSILSIRINGEEKRLFDRCWRDEDFGEERSFAGLVTNIKDSVIFPRMFDEFPIGVYELDDDNRIVYFNKKTKEIFGFDKGNEKEFLSKNINEFYVNQEDLAEFSEKVRQYGFAKDILKFKNVRQEIMELECFTKHLNEFNMARWGIINDVTKRERYYRALDRMPTGYYYIEYDQYLKKRHHGKIKQCNQQFANIIGVGNKDDLNMRDIEDFYVSKEEGEEYFRKLEEADQKGIPVLNYPFKLRRADNKKIVYISVDAHLVKEKGMTIGREGTIRDISKQVELEKKIKVHEERLDKITADINNLIHTFMHPVLKFSGHSELFHQLGTILYKSIRHNKKLGRVNLQKLGKELADKLAGIQTGLKNISENSESSAILMQRFDKIMNVFDYELNRAEKSDILLDKAIRDTALWILEELELIGFFDENIKKGIFKDVITSDFIEYVQNLLFEYLIRTAGILKGETQAMRREVEALRRYITFDEKKKYTVRKHNIKKILEANIELFKPILSQKNIEIDYQLTGNLDAMISENDIDRVICNLFHNASKYSDPGPGKFIKIKARDLQQEDAVQFSICSCGVPIKKHEIYNGDVFKFGYRGKLAYKMDRDGTGVGLADAKETIEAHGGTISITSEPIRNDGYPRQYNVSYITTVTVRLPKFGNKKEIRQ